MKFPAAPKRRTKEVEIQTGPQLGLSIIFIQIWVLTDDLQELRIVWNQGQFQTVYDVFGGHIEVRLVITLFLLIAIRYA